MGYTGVSLFLPYCGVMSTETGTSVGKSTFGGYWGLGGDFHGNGVDVFAERRDRIFAPGLRCGRYQHGHGALRAERSAAEVRHAHPARNGRLQGLLAERGDRSGCLHLLRCHRMGRRRHPYADGGYGRPAAGVGGYPEERYEAGPDIAPLRQPYLYRRRIRTAPQ